MLEVQEKDARKLLAAMGIKGAGDAEKMPVKRLEKKLRALPSLADKPPEDAADLRLFRKVAEALSDGDGIKVIGEGSNGEAEEAVPVPAKPASKGKKRGKETPSPNKEKVGVIASIVEFLSVASSKKPSTKKDLVDKLAKRFPDRSVEGMTVTVNAQLYRLRKEKGYNIESKDGAYWIPK
jgi:hypothetical protein